ncbi:MAG: hypothetical protein AAGF85_05020 [Bacteroidota bacterium]
MKYTIDSNSVVVVAKSHNPTLISDDFLVKSGIIKDAEEINKNNRIITPAMSNIQLLSGVNIQLDAERLVIVGQNNDEPFRIASSYCNTLTFIRASALGLNFDLTIDQYDVQKWFNKFNFRDIKADQVRLVKRFDRKKCIITITKITDASCKAQFNFHYGYKELVTLDGLGVNFIEEGKKNRTEADSILKEVFI